MSVGVTHCIITKYHNQNKSRGINASDIQTRYGTQPSVNSTHLQSSQLPFSVLFSSLFDGLARYGFASSLSIHMMYTALRFPLVHTQPKFCTAVLTNKSTNGPCNTSHQAVATVLLSPRRQTDYCRCHLSQRYETFNHANRGPLCFQRFSEQKIIICLCTFNISTFVVGTLCFLRGRNWTLSIILMNFMFQIFNKLFYSVF
jgi:hypothetical protein